MIRTKIKVNFGWNREEEYVHWQGQLRLTDGTIDDMQTCFRGAAFTSPQPGETEFHTRVNRVVGRDARHVELDMYSSKNPNVMTPAMQGVVLDVTASRTAKLVAEFNGHTYEHPIAELLEGPGAFSARMALRGRAVRTRTARGGFLRRALHGRRQGPARYRLLLCARAPA